MVGIASISYKRNSLNSASFLFEPMHFLSIRDSKFHCYINFTWNKNLMQIYIFLKRSTLAFKFYRTETKELKAAISISWRFMKVWDMKIHFSTINCIFKMFFRLKTSLECIVLSCWGKTSKFGSIICSLLVFHVSLLVTHRWIQSGQFYIFS